MDMFTFHLTSGGPEVYPAEGPITESLLKDFDGYIDPDGNFYATKPSGVGYFGGDYWLHERFAEWKLDDEQGDYAGCKERLVLEKHWVSVTTSTIDKAELTACAPERMTKRQEETLQLWVSLHGQNYEEWAKHNILRGKWVC